jgi:U3 small nucleolar ribonucleoprotein protein LCP5
VPYSSAPKSKTKRAGPVPTALRSLHDPALPHTESTSGLGNTPALLSSRAKYLKRLQEFEEENFGRVVMGKGEGKRRGRDEEDMALGAELGGGRGGGKNRRRGGLEDEFGDVLRSVERGGRNSRGGIGDGYDELRKGGRKKNVLERTKVNVRVRDEPDVEEGGRQRKRTRFEQETLTAKRRLKRTSS